MLGGLIEEKGALVRGCGDNCFWRIAMSLRTLASVFLCVMLAPVLSGCIAVAATGAVAGVSAARQERSFGAAIDDRVIKTTLDARLRKGLQPAPGASSLYFSGETATAPEAALINGTAGHALDYDDVGCRGHVSTVLVPAILAEAVRASGTSVVTVSDSVRISLESKVFKSPVVRIYNGIPLSPLVSGTSARHGDFGWHPEGSVVGFVGALYPLKGPHVLLDAFRLVDVPCELALLGPADPEYLNDLRDRARLCANKVSFLGFQDDVDSFMERIDLLVVPSIAFESFGMVILEAMKHRKSVICSDFGGMKEVVENGVTGLVVPAGDVSALSRAMITLLADAEARRQMGEAGYRRLSELFTAEKMVAQYDRLVFGH